MPYNIKADLNVDCWHCEHFQRYDKGTNPQSCAGECRRYSALIFQQGIMVEVDHLANKWWPVIENAQAAWCGEFVRTREKNLPPVPPLDEDDECEERLVLPDAWQDFWYQGNYWNKKIESGYVDEAKDGVCCFNCDHWNPLGSTPGITDGSCRRRPPGIYYEQFQPQPLWYNESWGNYAMNFLCVWCSEWTRTRTPRGEPLGGWEDRCGEIEEKKLAMIERAKEYGILLPSAKMSAKVPIVGDTKKAEAKKTTPKDSNKDSK